MDHVRKLQEENGSRGKELQWRKNHWDGETLKLAGE